VSILILGWLIGKFAGSLWKALAASIAICLAVGYGFHRFA